MLKRTSSISGLGLVAAVIAAAVFAVVSSGATRVEAAPQRCLDVNGRALNAVLVLNDQLVGSGCRESTAYAPWRYVAKWYVAAGYYLIPSAYKPGGLTPGEHFVANLASARYVIDPGMPQERIYVIDGATALAPAAGVNDPDSPYDDECCYFVTPPLAGLAPGAHVVRSYVTMRAVHWDGYDLIPDVNSLPQGEVLYDEVTLYVLHP